jgi:hypothetical protein
MRKMLPRAGGGTPISRAAPSVSPDTLAGDSSATHSNVEALPALRCLTFGAALSISTVERPSAR